MGRGAQKASTLLNELQAAKCGKELEQVFLWEEHTDGLSNDNGQPKSIMQVTLYTLDRLYLCIEE